MLTVYEIDLHAQIKNLEKQRDMLCTYMSSMIHVKRAAALMPGVPRPIRELLETESADLETVINAVALIAQEATQCVSSLTRN